MINRWMLYRKYKPRTQSHTDGGSERSSHEVITASRTQLTERTSETVETGLYGDSLSFHARMTFQHQRQLQEEGEMQNSAIAFGDSYRAKASAKKLAKTVEFPLNHEKEDLDREREREEEEAEAAERTRIQTIQSLQQNSQWTIAGTKREVQLLPDRKAHTVTVQAAARLLELQKISNGGSPSLTPQSSRLVVKKPTPSGTPHQQDSGFNLDADRERNSTGGLRGRLAPLVKLRALALAEEESRKQVAIKNFTFNKV